MNVLRDCWRAHVRPEHFEWTFDILATLYRPRERRAYHTSDHIEECLGKLLDLGYAVSEGPIDRPLAELALLFHDAVYVAGEPDNERNSMLLLESLRFTLRDCSAVERVGPIIIATAHKAEGVLFGNVTLAAVVDIDLSVLGREPKGYAKYLSEVRQEFAHVSNEAWRVGRMGFLADMLAREHIYRLGVMRVCYEERARQNMEVEHAVLQQGGGARLVALKAELGGAGP